MDYRIKALIIVICIFFISVFVFSGIYYTYNKYSNLDYERTYNYSLYFSFTIQSLVGLAEPATINQKGLQIWIIIQSFISYLVGLGIVFIIIKLLYKGESPTEIELKKNLTEISKELTEIKTMIKKLK